MAAKATNAHAAHRAAPRAAAVAAARAWRGLGGEQPELYAPATADAAANPTKEASAAFRRGVLCARVAAIKDARGRGGAGRLTAGGCGFAATAQVGAGGWGGLQAWRRGW